jgi:hypothetical protein
MRKNFAVLAGLGAVGLLLTGCGGGTNAITVTTLVPVRTVTQSASPTSSESGSALASPEAMKSYADAQMNEADPDAMRSALKLTAPNSIAYIYLDHEANMSEAALDGGQSLPKTEVTDMGDGTFKACNDPNDATSCLTFGDFKINAAGKLVDLTVNKQQIGPRITAGNGQAVTAGGTKFTLLTAYKSIQGNWLSVAVKIETGSQPIDANISSATYRDPDGKLRTATNSAGVTQIAANSNTIVAMNFSSVKAGGKVTLQGCVPQDCSNSYTAVINVG